MADDAPRTAPPFSDTAGKISFTIPFALFLLTLAVRPLAAEWIQNNTSLLLVGIGLLLAAGFLLGLYALSFAMLTRRFGPMIRAVLGVVLNGGFLLAVGIGLIQSQPTA